MIFKFTYLILSFLFPLQFLLSCSLKADGFDEEKIEIVYHIATMGNWKEIVQEQIDTFAKSGLGDACDRMTVTVVGNQIEEVYPLFSCLKFYQKVKIIHSSEDFHQYEFPGIEAVRQIALQDPNARILYVHSKGVTHYGKPSEQPSRFWRRYMEYFVIERWEDCINALVEADICGVDWTQSTSGLPFYAGNFWWAKGEYVLTCKLNYNNRFDCEAFIGTGDYPIATSFHQSGRNPKLMHLYTYEAYPQFFHFPPSSPYHRGIMNLYRFCYLDEYYRY